MEIELRKLNQTADVQENGGIKYVPMEYLAL